MVKNAKAEPDPIDFSDEVGGGFENVQASDLGIPFLGIVQGLSPELDKHHQKFIADAQVGDIFNSITRDIYGGEESPCIFVPCTYQKLFIEWKPREKGGGIVRMHRDVTALDNTTRDEKGRDVLPNGNNIVTTAYFFGLVLLADEEPVRCVISFTSTQLKKSRMWLSQMSNIKLEGKNGKFTPPMYSHKYSLTTCPEQNEKGKWMGWKIECLGLINDVKVIESARAIKKQSLLPPAPVESDNNGGEGTPF